jgi:hypothetical protein
MPTDRVAVPTAEREIGRALGRLILRHAPQFLSRPTRQFATLGWKRCARTRDRLSNPLPVRIEQYDKSQTINLRGHEF